MSFQFCCPQGHVLQGDLASIGQVVPCPVCGVNLFVPPPDCGASMSGGFLQASGTWPPTGAAADLPVAMPTEPASPLSTPVAAASEPKAGRARGLAFPDEAAKLEPPPKIVHLRCPSGHMLKTSREHLGKLGRCSSCQEAFPLRYENSLEFQRREAKLRRHEAGRSGLFWLVLPFFAAMTAFAAIVAAVLRYAR